MEKFPRSSEGEVPNDEVKENFESEVVVDEIGEETEGQELQAFKNQLNKGLEFYCQVSGEKREEADIHPEQKLFFSYLKANTHGK